MAVPRKLAVVPKTLTRELWRIAESGDMDELGAVLPQADINARNEHGVTALMRAACHGYVQLVRVLLEHGADPNVKRNDNFTALSLAAFFGHAEIVEILMGHGANADVPTRFGTSPQMWARARNFGDVARCLEKRRDTKKSVSPPSPKFSTTPPRTSSATAPPPASTTPPLAPPVVVHALKDPPEIWDLVQEAPRNFDVRSAFLTRIGSMKRGFVIPVAALVVIVAVVIGAVLLLKDATPVRVVEPVTAVEPVVVPPANQSPGNQLTENESAQVSNVAAEAPAIVNEPVNAPVTTNVSRRSRRFATTPATSDELNPPSESVEIPAAPAIIAAPQTDSGVLPQSETKKSPAPVNTQVISPPKSTQTKAKVIQWP